MPRESYQRRKPENHILVFLKPLHSNRVSWITTAKLLRNLNLFLELPSLQQRVSYNLCAYACCRDNRKQGVCLCLNNEIYVKLSEFNFKKFLIRTLFAHGVYVHSVQLVSFVNKMPYQIKSCIFGNHVQTDRVFFFHLFRKFLRRNRQSEKVYFSLLFVIA